jgi:hypothetical protein
MRKIIWRSVGVCLLLAVAAGAYVGWRAFGVYRAGMGTYQHLRYLLESGESVEGVPADDVLSDSYLLSLFGDNPELVDRLKTVVDLGMATDANLKLGNVSCMIVTYRRDPEGNVVDTAIYAIGGFPDPKSKRLGFHSAGYFEQQLEPAMWLTGNAIMNLLGRDIIVFCEQDKAEAHMSLLFDVLNGHILPLAQRIAETKLYYAIVFPSPKELAPPHLRTKLQPVIIKGEMDGASGHTETMLISSSARAAAQVHIIMQDMLRLARIVFHERYTGYIKEMNWGGPMNDMWWAVEYVRLVDNIKMFQDQVLVIARADSDRFQNNAILKTIERAGRDMAMQKSYLLASELPWEFAFNKENPSGGYWSVPHRWGAEWPLGDEGIPTPGSIAAAAERERLRAEKEAEQARARAAQTDDLKPADAPAGEPPVSPPPTGTATPAPQT